MLQLFDPCFKKAKFLFDGDQALGLHFARSLFYFLSFLLALRDFALCLVDQLINFILGKLLVGWVIPDWWLGLGFCDVGAAEWSDV